MKVKETIFEGVFEIEPEIFADERGHLFESYNVEKLKEFNIPGSFPLEISSHSKKGVIRGLHFQKEPFAQGKLIRIVSGSVIDVVVDLRKDSKTYGKWASFNLDDKNKKMLWIPTGFAHGFLALEDGTTANYKTTNLWKKESEGGVIWNDPTLKIDWQLEKLGIKEPIISEKDSRLPLFSELG